MKRWKHVFGLNKACRVLEFESLLVDFIDLYGLGFMFHEQKENWEANLFPIKDLFFKPPKINKRNFNNPHVFSLLL